MGSANRLTAKQAAAVLGVSRSQLARYRRAGRITGVKYGGHTRVRYSYDPADLERFQR